MTASSGVSRAIRRRDVGTGGRGRSTETSVTAPRPRSFSRVAPRLLSQLHLRFAVFALRVEPDTMPFDRHRIRSGTVLAFSLSTPNNRRRRDERLHNGELRAEFALELGAAYRPVAGSPAATERGEVCYKGQEQDTFSEDIMTEAPFRGRRIMRLSAISTKIRDWIRSCV